MSMISEQIEQLNSIYEKMKFCEKNSVLAIPNKYEVATIKEAINTITELSAKLHAAQMERSSMYYNGGWIPCEERLPENKINPITCDGYMYPITYKNGKVTDIRYYTFVNGHWYHGAGIMDEYVIAWMQKPEPYQPKESEEQVNERD